MQTYQLTVLIKNEIDEKNRKGILESLSKNFSKVVKEDLWGVRSLAYPIKHQNKAFYAHFNFEAEPSQILELDKAIKLNEDIMRSLLIREEIKKQKSKVKKETKEEDKE